MKHLLGLALDATTSSGASYADVRIVEETRETLLVKNGKVEMIEREEDAGFGVRALVRGAWGFASSAELSKAEVKRVSQLSLRVAESSGRVMDEAVTLADSDPAVGSYQTEYEVDPFEVPLGTKLEFLLQIEKSMRKVKGVSIAEAQMTFWKTKKWFASSEGSLIEQNFLGTGASMKAFAVKDGDLQVRTYPSLRGQFALQGYELIEQLKMSEHARRVGEEAVELVTARACPNVTTNLIMGSALTAIFTHETVGHPTELDRVFGSEANFAGTSHLTPDKLGDFVFASPKVTIVADATISGGLGSFGWDDEGIPAASSDLIRDGVFVGYLTSRETADVLGQKSNGAMRAEGWKNVPLIRMTNINVLPGEGSMEDMIADTRDGFLFDGFKTVSIDDKRLNFNLGPEVGWVIKGGKKQQMVKAPVFTGISYKAWRDCDWVGGEEDWVLWGESRCGKGEPIQIMKVGHGTPPVRFSSVEIGAKV